MALATYPSLVSAKIMGSRERVPHLLWSAILPLLAHQRRRARRRPLFYPICFVRIAPRAQPGLVGSPSQDYASRIPLGNHALQASTSVLRRSRVNYARPVAMEQRGRALIILRGGVRHIPILDSAIVVGKRCSAIPQGWLCRTARHARTVSKGLVDTCYSTGASTTCQAPWCAHHHRLIHNRAIVILLIQTVWKRRCLQQLACQRGPRPAVPQFPRQDAQLRLTPQYHRQ